jgi:hypothetical protein
MPTNTRGRSQRISRQHSGHNLHCTYADTKGLGCYGDAATYLLIFSLPYRTRGFY